MNTDKDIEDKLIRSRGVSLSHDEKRVMKHELLSHAARTLTHEKVETWWSVWMFRGSVAFASVLFVFGGTAYASMNSMPDEPLYAMKVHVVEEIIGATKFSHEDVAAYDLELMETRLLELQALAVGGENIEPDVLTLVHEQIEEHTTDSLEAIAAFDHNSTAIDALSDLASVAEAQEKLVTQNKSFSALAERSKKTKRRSTSALQSTVTEYVKSAPEHETIEYIGDTLTEVSEQIVETTPDIESQEVTEMKLDQANEALSDGLIDEAIMSALEAQQEITSEEYLDTEVPPNEDEDS